MQEALTNVALVVLAGYCVYLLLETLITRIWFRHVPHLPVRTNKTPPGAEATVVTAFQRSSDGKAAYGQVKVGGELWQAVIDADVEPEIGDRLEVLAREGLVLRVGTVLQR